MLEYAMMIGFLVAAGLGFYKFYALFGKEDKDAIDIRVIEEELAQIVRDIMKKEKTLSKEKLFERVFEHENFDSQRYFNFNLNRFNQVLDKLILEHKAKDFEDLKEKL